MSTAAENKFLLLMGKGPFPIILANALYDHFGPFTILVEDKEPTKVMVFRRIKILGLVETVGQVVFSISQKCFSSRFDTRKKEIIAANNLNLELPKECELIQVGDVNSEKCRQTLAMKKPQLIVVIGTRIIKNQTLRSTDATIINYHAGLNPTYRGVNGGYWALANCDSKNFGITIHLVDEGVDTGETLAFERLTPSPRDNIATYPYLQVTAARSMIVKVVEDILSGKHKVISIDGQSRQWFHPTFWGYLWTGLRRGVW